MDRVGVFPFWALRFGCGAQKVEQVGLRSLHGFGWIEGILDGSHAFLPEVIVVRDHFVV